MHPTQIYRYQITAEIGRGGMATVYQAHDPRFDRDIAIKILPREFLHDPTFKARFEREAKTVALLEHPAIVPVYDYGEFEGLPYMVMRLMTGGSLEDHLQKGPLSLGQIANILNQIGAALDVAHQKGVIHRDLKPGNILFDQYGDAYLSDFGIARLKESQLNLTGSGIIGTPAYMSPEQVQGEEDLDGRSDIYSLGIILFQMLTGKMPFSANTPASLLLMHLTEPIPDVSAIDPQYSTSFDHLIAKAMAKDREERYQSAAELAADFQNVLRGKPTLLGKTKPTIPGIQKDSLPTRISQKKIDPGKGRRLNWIIGGGIIGVLAIIALVAGASHFLSAKLPTATFTPTVTHTLAANQQPTLIPLPIPSATSRPSMQPPTNTPTTAPTSTPIPSATATPTPQHLSIGDADEIAFVNANNIWVADIAGNNVQQLTTDGNLNKSHLIWSPDGKSVLYLEGLCLRSVTLDGVADVITCFDSSRAVEAMALSPDKTQIAFSIDHFLYVVPFDLEALRTVNTRSALGRMSEFGGYCGSVHDELLDIDWSQDNYLQLKVYVPDENAYQVEVIRKMRVSSCGQNVIDRLSEIPAQLFSTANYSARPSIPSYDWDGNNRIVFNDVYRRPGYGDLLVYDTQKHQLVKITESTVLNPIGNECCYGDVRWSPDGTYLLFAHLNIETNQTQLYYIRYGLIGVQSNFAPLPLDGLIFQQDSLLYPAIRTSP